MESLYMPKLIMKLLPLVLLGYLNEVKADFTKTEKAVGCKKQDASENFKCPEACRLGVADCQDPYNLKCEFGYFLFTKANGVGAFVFYEYDCVRCPYQQYSDPLSLYCMDCVENPYTWDQTRQCTYDYTILNGDADEGTYTKIQRTVNETFLVGSAVDSGKNSKSVGVNVVQELKQVLQVYLCTGCDRFCNENDFNCNKIAHAHTETDLNHEFVYCLDGYVYNAVKEKCVGCPVNCQKCSFKDGEFFCRECPTGYALNPETGQCVVCMNECNRCYYSLSGQNMDGKDYSQLYFQGRKYDGSKLQMYCRQCDKDDQNDLMIPTLDMTQCVYCGQYCSRCEFISTKFMGSPQENYPTRNMFTNGLIMQNEKDYLKVCRQCKQTGQYISLDGKSCSICTIDNCQWCYAQWTTTNTISKSNDLNYLPPSGQYASESEILCGKCTYGYYLSIDQQTCLVHTSVGDVEKALEATCSSFTTDVGGDEVCQDCYSVFYDLDKRRCAQDDDKNVDGVSLKYNCYDQFDNCLACYRYYSLDNYEYQQWVQSFDLDGNEIWILEDAKTQFYSYACSRCEDGYYPDIFTGKCLSCQPDKLSKSCGRCSQYTLEYNYTDYIQTKPKFSQGTLQSMQSQYPVLGPFCIGCSNGYTYLSGSNTCEACGIDCYACTYTSTSAYCSSCWNYQQLALSNDRTVCMSCPDNCAACRDRTLEEKNRINPVFSPTSQSLERFSKFCYKDQTFNQVFYDTEIGMPILCTASGDDDTKRCQISVTVDVTINCNAKQQGEPGMPSDYEYYLSSFQSSTTLGIQSIYFTKLEIQDNYELWNKEVVQKMILNIQLLGDTCTIPSETQLDIRIQQNVFSLKDFQVNLNGKYSPADDTYGPIQDNTQLKLKSILHIVKLTNIGIRGINIFPSDDAGDELTIFGLSVEQNLQTEVIMQNVFISSRFSDPEKALFVFYLNNVNKLRLVDVYFADMNYSQIKELNPIYTIFDISKAKEQSTFVDNVHFNDITLSGATLFEVNQIYIAETSIEVGNEGLFFTRCYFSNTTIFGQSVGNNLQAGLLRIGKMVIEDTIFTKGSYITFYTALKRGYYNNIDILDTQFTKSSNGFVQNGFILTSIYCYKLLFSDQSNLFKSQPSLIDDQSLIGFSTYYAFSKVHIDQTDCGTVNCLMYLATPANNFGFVIELQIETFQVRNTMIGNMDADQLNSISSSIIYISNAGKVSIKEFLSQYNIGVTVVSIRNILFVEITDSVCDWKKYEIGEEVDLKLSNKLPVSLTCSNTKKKNKIYSNKQFFIQNFKYGVIFTNFVMKNLLSISDSFIFIQSYDLLDLNTTRSILDQDNIQFVKLNSKWDLQYETIQCIGCQFHRNKLAIVGENDQSSMIQVISNQHQILKFDGCEFTENHMHQLIAEQTVASSTLILIDSINSEVFLNGVSFLRNIASKMQYGIIYIIANDITIEGSTFDQTNLYTENWVDNLEAEQLTDEEAVEFFYIESIGSNLFIRSYNTTITGCSFSNSFAREGAGLYIQPISYGSIQISDTKFNNLAADLVQDYQSKGGCIYISSLQSKLSIMMDNVIMDGCFSRKEGGCIFIEPSTLRQDITIQNSDFYNCYSQSGSFLSVKFPATSKVVPTVQLKNVYVQQDKDILLRYYYSLPDLSEIEQAGLGEFISVYSQENGQLDVDGSVFEQLYYASIFDLQNLNDFSMQDVSFSQIEIFIRPMISVSLRPDQSGTVNIANVKIHNVVQIDPDQITADSLSKEESQCAKLAIESQQITVPIQSCKTIYTVIKPVTPVNEESEEEMEEGEMESEMDGETSDSEEDNSEVSSDSEEDGSSEESEDGSSSEDQVDEEEAEVYDILSKINPDNMEEQEEETLTDVYKYGWPLYLSQEETNNEELDQSSEEDQEESETEMNQGEEDSQFGGEESIEEGSEEGSEINEENEETVSQPYDGPFFILNKASQEIVNSRMLCLATLQLYQKQIDVSNQLDTSLFTLNQLKANQKFTVASINLDSNNCSRCFGGLFQVRKISSQATKPIAFLEDINCEGNVGGYFGCFHFSTLSIPQKIITEFGFAEDELHSDETVARRNLVENLPSLSIDDVEEVETNRLMVEDFLEQLEAQTLSIEVQNGILKGNQAYVGAGISIYGLNSLVSGVKFLDNFAEYMGGGLFYQSIRKSSFYLYNSFFQGNIAQAAGAMMLIDTTIGKTQELQIDFQDNQAENFGANLAEFPQKLSVQLLEGQTLPIKTFNSQNGDEDNDGFVDNRKIEIRDIVDIQPYTVMGYESEAKYLILPSGQNIKDYKFYNHKTQEQIPYNYVFRVLNLDRFYQPLSSISSSASCVVSGRELDETVSQATNDQVEFSINTYTFGANTFNFDVSLGAFNLDDLQINYDPKSNRTKYLQLKIECNSIQIPVYQVNPPYKIKFYNTKYALYLNIQTFDCQLGEYYDGISKCVACAEGSNTFSVKENSRKCTTIDLTSMNAVTPALIHLKPGYWRPYDVAETIVRCKNLLENCIGGWSVGNEICFEGHVGALCESCDLYAVRDGVQWAQSAKYKCGRCDSILPQNTAIIIVISFTTLISIIITVKSSSAMIDEFLRNEVLKTMGVLVSSSKNNLAILLKILTNYFQIIGAIATFQLDLGTTGDSVETVGNPVKSMAVSYDCFFLNMAPDIKVLYFRMIWALCMPFFYLNIFLFGYFFAVLIGKAPYKTNIVYTTFIYMFTYLQPTLLAGFMSIASTRMESEYPWVQADVNYRSDTTDHQNWVGAFVAPNIALWAVVFPGIFLYCVVSSRKTLHERTTRQRWGFFYNEYTLTAYYWEFIKIFQKELLSIALIYYEDKIIIKGLIVFLLVFGYQGLAIRVQAYKSGVLNFLDIQSATVCSLSFCLGALIYACMYQYNETSLGLFFFAILIIINVLFIVEMLGFILGGYGVQFEDKVDKVRDSVRKSYPNLEVKYPWLRKHLINRTALRKRILYLWGVFRLATHQGIARRKIDKLSPMIMPIEHITHKKSEGKQQDEKQFIFDENKNKISKVEPSESNDNEQHENDPKEKDGNDPKNLMSPKQGK